MLGLCSGFPPAALAEDFFGENTLCAFFLLNVLCISLAAVFLAGREDVLFLRFAGGPSLDAWHFLLVACACCLAGVPRGLGNVPAAAAGGWERWRRTPPVTAMAGGQALPHAGKPGTSGPRDPVPRLRSGPRRTRARTPRSCPAGSCARCIFGSRRAREDTARPTGDRSRCAGSTGWARDAGRGGVAAPLGVPRGSACGRGCQVTLNPRVHACEVLGIPLRNKGPLAT